MTISPFDEKSKQSSHRALPRRSQQEHLIDLKTRQLRGEFIEPHGQLEIVLSRIRPDPTPLYEIQQNATGKGFISDPQARIFYLKNKFGFNIENRIDRSTKPARSFYWLVLDESGTGPKMNSVEYAETKTGRPKHQPVSPAPEPQPQDERGQSLMFGDLSSRRPMSPVSGKSFADRERGA